MKGKQPERNALTGHFIVVRQRLLLPTLFRLMETIESTVKQFIGPPSSSSLLPKPQRDYYPSSAAPYTEAEEIALQRVINHLPVSGGLTVESLVFLRVCVGEYFLPDGKETVVTVKQVQEAYNKCVEGYQPEISEEDMRVKLNEYLQIANPVVIGQLEIHHELGVDGVRVRVNVPNFVTLLEGVALVRSEGLI